MIRLAVFGVLLALITWLLHRRLVRATGLQGGAARAVDALLVVGYVLALVGVGSGEVFDTAWARPLGFAGWVWLAGVFYLVLGVLVLGVLSLLGRIVTKPTDPRRRTALRVGTAAVAVAATGAVGYGVVEAARPGANRVRVPLARLPQNFDGLRVAVVSDLHIGPSRGAPFTQEIVDLVNAEQPDLVVLAGDLTDGTVELVAADVAPLRDLRAPYGVVAVSGNHEAYADDVGSWLDAWEELGITVLRNEHVTLDRDGERIHVAGIYDHESPEPYTPDLDAALRGREPGEFVLLAAHQPIQAHDASDHDVDLQVSGHTHGGQMWPIRHLVPLQQPTVEGLDRIGRTTVFTTRGAGTWGPPVRVGAPPEVSILELTRS
ncbi:metallophosphoesterase [Rhodococcus rhodnii]|uniref:Phosphoesterase n=2 Tax=Rhodococcus rhodnii TaxID=38312 RepID=R7WT28_9NOCA|nr:metallophosphoesterase [Rhodococcus rhodnii]EOM78427.1 phosphoesterase [Rhodococcus rhodnii LMG 5362]TXG91244.1 metallophosphoesterase [Rhodococcus rhodnii]